MKAVIIEDEILNYREICRILRDIDPQMIISPQLATIGDVRSYLLTHDDSDIILADIRIGDGLVFEALADAVGEVAVIFTTAYDEYAIRAFDYNGIAYLLKPIRKEDLERALLNVRKRRASSNRYRQLLLDMRQGTGIFRKHFLASHADYYDVIGTDKISHIMSENNITRLHLIDGHSVVVDHSLNELEQQLDPAEFFRANRQCIVHIDHVKRLHNWFKGKTQLQVDCYPDLCIEISKERTSKLKQWLDK